MHVQSLFAPIKFLILLLVSILKKNFRMLRLMCILVITSMCITLIIGKIYQHWDDHPDRGAIAITSGEFGEDFSTPVYLDQGWDNSDSMWFYNTTQGSNLIPYDFFLALELADSEEKFKSDKIFHKYRYLPQAKSFFNEDALAVGFTKDEYKGRDYIGYTCAACHTAQINYKGQAIRIDGGPAMADMVGYLHEMQKAMMTTRDDKAKRERFINNVLALDNDYSRAEEVEKDLEKWTGVILNYNTVNHSKVKYGFSRLDAFGRIFNRVLQHVINKDQARTLMLIATNARGERMLTPKQVDAVLKGVDETIIGDNQFALILERLSSDEGDYPNLSYTNILRLRDYLFNEPNAPVSYPFLWDITHSDYVQWNGIAGNAGAGPLGRNAGEVTGVFATLDWQASEPFFSLSAHLSGQKNKHKKVKFESSTDLTNLKRLEHQLKSLKSPLWPQEMLGSIDQEQAQRGQLIYANYCQSCHQVIDRNDWDRVVIGHMSSLEDVKTDPAMAENSINYKGKTGNFQGTYQGVDVGGDIILGEEAPVAVILTATTRGVVATPDPDKGFIRRWLDLIYTLAGSFFDNDIKPSIKQGTYEPDTTAEPFRSLLSYKARSLNGIWATAPYLHNGSVPTLYDLLLPKKREGDPEDGRYRPDTFTIGTREFDPKKVGFVYEGYEGFSFTTNKRGNFNNGHEYAAGRTPQPNGEILPSLTEAERWDLLEYLKTL